jgi:nucleoid-associated protein EbfC
MFGQMGQLLQLLKDAPRISQNVKEMQERLSTTRLTAEAGGGQVRATFDGKGDMLELRIEPALVQTGDTEMIEELVRAAVLDGARQCRELAQREMQTVMGGMDLGGMMKMFGG